MTVIIIASTNRNRSTREFKQIIFKILTDWSIRLIRYEIRSFKMSLLPIGSIIGRHFLAVEIAVETSIPVMYSFRNNFFNQFNWNWHLKVVISKKLKNFIHFLAFSVLEEGGCKKRKKKSMNEEISKMLKLIITCKVHKTCTTGGSGSMCTS